MCSSWYVRRRAVAFVFAIHLSAVAFVLLHFGPFARRLWAIVSCSVMERGAVSG